MSDLAPPLRRVLSETGYLTQGGSPAASTVTICNGDERWRGTLEPEVRWRDANLNVYFKFADSPATEIVSTWQQEVWNNGSVPLLWVVEPHQTTLYNGFAKPQGGGTLTRARLDVFRHNGAASMHCPLGLSDLGARAGRLAMETGTFWNGEKRIDRREAVDAWLLRDIALLESKLCQAGLSVDRAQGLIGRAIFAQYLVDRGIITRLLLQKRFNGASLPDILRNRTQATDLFRWLMDKFNGDMFPSGTPIPAARHLERVADFFDGVNLETQQMSLFPYRFDLVPVELISSIYEQFVHSADEGAKNSGVYYTPLAVVSLILDQVMNDLTGDETVLDITCGSGVFLVEALRRLVRARAGAGEPTRAMIRDTLYHQVYGVDISPAAIRVAAFSLYLAALELDRAPRDGRGMRFRPLVGRTLLVGDAHSIDVAARTKRTSTARAGFDLIVGNPPFTEDRDGTNQTGASPPQPPRDRSLVFAERAWGFAHAGSRFGMVLKATPFFSRHAGKAAAQNIVDSLGSATLVNLSSCSSWLFRCANAPVVALLAGHRTEQPAKHLALVQAHWSPAGLRAHAFDITAGDVTTLHTDSWKRNADLLKAACLGSYDDMMLLERMHNTLRPLASHLQDMNAKFNVGLILGLGGKPAPKFLQGMPALSQLRSFAPQGELGPFRASTAHRPRERAIYNAPLLIVQEYMDDGAGAPRAVVACLDQDVVFTNAFYGASLPTEEAETGHLLTGILSSAVASWYFIMAGSTFGIDKRRLLQEDVAALPLPNFSSAATARARENVIALATSFVTNAPNEVQWRELDEAVFDLYELDDQERQVVRDGVFRAGWQWERGRLASVAPATSQELAEYARAFQSAVAPWLPRDGTLRMRAEICEYAAMHPLRAIRFFLDEDSRPPDVEFAAAADPRLADVYFGGSLADVLDGHEHVNITPDGCVVVVKPSARRHWLPSLALGAARTVLEQARFPSSADDTGAEPRPCNHAPVDEEVALRYRVGYRNNAGIDDDLAEWTSEGPWPEV